MDGKNVFLPAVRTNSIFLILPVVSSERACPEKAVALSVVEGEVERQTSGVRKVR